MSGIEADIEIVQLQPGSSPDTAGEVWFTLLIEKLN